MRFESKTSVCIFLLGLTGVMAMVLSPMVLPIPAEVLEKVSMSYIKMASFIQSTILVGLMVLLGHFTARKVGLSAPFIESFLRKEFSISDVIKPIQQSAIFGLIGGVVMSVIAAYWMNYLPPEFIEFGETMQVSVMLRFLYGGITEEVLVRWGLMSFFVWLFWKVFQSKKQDKPSDAVYWIGIFIAAFLFGAGHLPVAFIAVEEVTTSLLAYIICLNMMFGIIAGWLYWKKGLETAMVAHMFAHVGMLFCEAIF